MKIRALTVFVAALAVVAAALLWTDRNRQPQALDERVGQTPLPVDTARSAVAIVITPADASSIRLEDRGDGVWILPDYHRLPADFGKVSRLVSNLTDARIERFVSANPERTERLGLGRHTIELLGSNADQTLATLILGRRSERGGGSYFRFEGEDRTYLLDRSLSPDREAALWASKTPLPAGQETVRQVFYEFRDGTTFSALRETPGDDFVSDPNDNTAGIQQEPFLAALGNLLTTRYNEVALRDNSEAIEASENIAGTATITLFDAGSIRASWGRRPEQILEKDEDSEGTDESEADETIPAGKPFLFLEFPEDSSSPWAEPSRGLAFQIADFYFNRLPENSSGWLE